MQVGFTDDQTQFRDIVRRFLADKSPPSEVRRLMATETGYDAKVWAQACGELGLAGIHLPEEFGGSGFGPIELGIVAEEMGRHLFCGPYLSSAVMAGYAILNQGTQQQKESLLPGIAGGSCVATLALDDLNDVRRVGSNVSAKVAGDAYSLTGTAAKVIDAQAASLLVVAAKTDDGVELFHLPADSSGVSMQPLEVLDTTRRLSRIEFADATAERLGDSSAPDLDLLWNQIASMLASEMIGGAARLFETTLDYMKLRVQFGRVIGSFQALKHRCADLLMELELARAAAHDATRALASGIDGTGIDGTGVGGAGVETYSANMAKAMASDAYIEVARAAIQLRGGIGFTWEEDTQLWFKRAKSSEVLLGSSVWHREEMIRKLEQKTEGATANV